MLYTHRQPAVNLFLKPPRIKFIHVITMLHNPKLQFFQNHLQYHKLRTQMLGGVNKKKIEKAVSEDRDEHIPG